MKISHSNKKLNPNLRFISEKVKEIGKNCSQIISIYLYGSVSRGEANKKSDLDLLFLVKKNTRQNFLDVLMRDKKYIQLYHWAINQFEGGIIPLVVSSEELTRDFDTLAEKILLEGLLLYGKEMKEVITREELPIHDRKKDLLGIVRSL